jgi:hypothetical protein
MLIVKQPHHTKSGGVCFVVYLNGVSHLIQPHWLLSSQNTGMINKWIVKSPTKE